MLFLPLSKTSRVDHGEKGEAESKGTLTWAGVLHTLLNSFELLFKVVIKCLVLFFSTYKIPTVRVCRCFPLCVFHQIVGVFQFDFIISRKDLHTLMISLGRTLFNWQD